MMHRLNRAWVVGLVCFISLPCWATRPTADEMSGARRWVSAALDGSRDGSQLPFSFSYGGKPFRQICGSWRFASSSAPIDENRVCRTVSFSDPVTGLIVRCEAIEYRDYPTVEWIVYFANAGLQDTPILTDIKALDLSPKRGPGAEFLLHHNHHAGSRVDYQPFITPLAPGLDKFLVSRGKSTVGDWPCFNLQWGDQGLIAVLGWPGNWAANFIRDPENGLRVAGGQEIAAYKLRPGEETRTPQVVLQFWQGDYARSQNPWRRWMLAHVMPQPGGRPLAPLLSASNTQHFPNGLKAVSDYGRQNGMKFLVWFHPEVVILPAKAQTWLNEQRQWILGPQYQDQYIINFGNPRTWGWIVNQVDRVIHQEGIDLYRHDFNTDFYAACNKNDSADRKGITEVRCCQGFLAYYDELRRRHPGMLVDNCSSGYGRNDLETLHRSVPLWRSDDFEDPTRQQCITQGIAPWIPYHGTGVFMAEAPAVAYVLWSKMTPSLLLGWDLRLKNLDYDRLRKLVQQWRTIAPYYLADYYPLTPFSVEKNVWTAFQYDRPEAGDGLIQVFRRDECDSQTFPFKLVALDSESQYDITDLEDGTPRRVSGSELREKGLAVTATNRPAAVVMTYRKTK